MGNVGKQIQNYHQGTETYDASGICSVWYSWSQNSSSTNEFDVYVMDNPYRIIFL